MQNHDNSRDKRSPGLRASRLRRSFMLKAAGMPLLLAAGSIAAARSLAATPACGEQMTPRQTSGPFYKPHSPQRTTLVESGGTGERMLLTGRVVSTACEPVAGALIDFWHCDAKGNYDNRGFRFRGHQFSGSDGGFSLETLKPGLYPGRTRHIHVIVQAANRRPLVTQLYFPGEALNEDDWLFDPRLLMSVGGQAAQFDFVLDLKA